MTLGGTWALQYGEGAAPRAPRDLYTEPPEAVEALCKVERFTDPVWDPACGTRSLVKVLEGHGYDVYGTDIAMSPPDGDGDPGDDFTRGCIPPVEPIGSIVSNPPYSLADAFVLRALDLATHKVAMFLRVQWLEGERRYRRIYRDRPPARVWVFRHRLGMVKRGQRFKDGMYSHAWFVWDLTASVRATELRWISARVAP